jgi:H+/Cl- antiporter ClcA
MERTAILRSLVVAAVLGAPVALVTMLLMEGIHVVQHGIWHDVPAQFEGWVDGPPWWYVVGVTTLAATLAAVLLSRIATDVAHEMSLTPPPLRHLPWLLAGALATLAGGLVLGPEAPLLALGIALMGVAARATSTSASAAMPDGGSADDPTTAMLALAGAAIVLGMVLASPLLAIVLMVEFVAASGKVPAKQVVPVLLPAMLAAGTGALVFVGIGSWTGLEPPSLVIPDLPTYDQVAWIDLLVAPVVALLAAGTVLAFQRLSAAAAPRTRARPIVATAGVGLVTGALAVGYRAATDRPIDDVLFSGQTALPDIVGIDTAWILLALVVAKGIAWSLALVGRLEGGQIFPAMALAAAVGTAVASVVDGSSLTALLVVSIAAGTTALQRMPIFGIVFGLLIAGGSQAYDLAPLAILGGVVGFVVASAANRPDAAAASVSASAHPGS